MAVNQDTGNQQIEVVPAPGKSPSATGPDIEYGYVLR